MNKLKSKRKLILIVLVVLVVLFALVAGGLVYSQQIAKGSCTVIQEREYCEKDYLGLTEQKAIEKAQANNISPKVIERDGNTSIANYDIGGVQAKMKVENNIVTEINFTR